MEKLIGWKQLTPQQLEDVARGAEHSQQLTAKPPIGWSGIDFVFVFGSEQAIGSFLSE